MIGYLGGLLRQPSNIYKNLAAQTRRVTTINTLTAMWPELQAHVDDPRGSKDLGDEYLLLGPRDTSLYHLSHVEQTTLDTFFSDG